MKVRAATWPGLITLAGLFAGLAGVLLLDASPATAAALLVISLGLDMLDGYVARRVDGATEFGAEFDWHTDTCLAALLVWSLPIGDGRVLVLALLVMWQALAHVYAHRVSGRAAATAAVVGAVALGL